MLDLKPARGERAFALAGLERRAGNVVLREREEDTGGRARTDHRIEIASMDGVAQDRLEVRLELGKAPQLDERTTEHGPHRRELERRAHAGVAKDRRRFLEVRLCSYPILRHVRGESFG